MAINVPRRQVILLASLLVVLAAILAHQLRTPGSPSAPAGAGTRPAARGQAAAPLLEVPDVHLEALEAERPAPIDGGRNLFRDRPEPPPEPVAVPSPAQARRNDAERTPAGPPPPPPITLKFIGIVQAGGRAVAVLSDGRDVLYGREGEVVDGQYLIVKINVETVEVSYADGSGRRVIRLTG